MADHRCLDRHFSQSAKQARLDTNRPYAVRAVGHELPVHRQDAVRGQEPAQDSSLVLLRMDWQAEKAELDVLLP
jgi:hypothetical protein